MSEYYPYNDQQIAEAARKRKVNAIFAKILELRARHFRLRQWGIATNLDLDSIETFIELYSWELEKLDSTFYNENYVNLPPL